MAFGKLQHYASLDEAIASIFGNNIKVTETQRVYGGDINRSYRLALSDGGQVFLKTDPEGQAFFFQAEAAGLSAISKTGAIGAPKALCTGEDCGGLGGAFLLLEFLEKTAYAADYWEVFGHKLADMHRAGTKDFVDGGTFGFYQDNYIGANRQKNAASESWAAFFRDCRLQPQFAQAGRYFDSMDRARIHKLLGKLDDILVEPKQPSLLHGDLWSGNFMAGKDGKAWLIDPAVSVGHAEADIAMTELFGGFPQRFYDAYREGGCIQEGYEGRRNLYNLYHLLNHLNLFGGTYLHPVRDIIREYTR